MIEHKQEMKADGNARRKLLRGAFAAPAVLTVYSGGALAATSSTCLARANNVPKTTGIEIATSDDVLFRYELWQKTKIVQTVPATPTTYWIVGSDLVTYQHAGQSAFLTASQWQKFDIAANQLLSGSVTTTSPATSSAYTFMRPSSGKQFVVLRINSAGAVVGAGNAGTGAPVSDSCWNSFMMGPG